MKKSQKRSLRNYRGKLRKAARAGSPEAAEKLARLPKMGPRPAGS
jgi:hypothetical protein